ncbi:MAG: acyl-CoA dehydrogenase, partial [Nonomuraea sp.]|nr:acyl-CoA dehydrogenase [Nonomuraea sp.]
MSFAVPDHIRPIRDAVHAFMTERVEPAEEVLREGGQEAAATMGRLREEARKEGLWALGHPRELGGGGLPFLDYVYVNEVQGRSEYGQLALGTFTLQDSLMLHEHASPEQRARYLEPLVRGDISPSFAMTEPEVSSSDPTQLATVAVLDGGEWVIDGHKWFTTGASVAAYTTVMCRTEPDAPPHRAFSMILVPTDTPGYTIVRETPVLGLGGAHCEVRYENVRVPAGNLLGERGHGFAIAQKRLGPGRIFHCMRWLGQAQRAFDLMCRRLHARTAFGEPLAAKQLMRQHVFDSYTEIQAARLLTLQAAEAIDAGSQARVEIGAIKVVGARMLHNVIDRA